jgi:hypothetical protein
MIKLRIKRWEGHVSCMEESRNAYRIWLGNVMERNHLESPSVDGRIILRWIFRKSDRGYGLD